MAFEIRRGTNVSHWLSQSDQRGRQRTEGFTRRDVTHIAELGFDHVRIPVDEDQLWDDSGRPDAEALGLLDAALDWCASTGLRAVVDLHILRSHYFNDPGVPALWTDPAEAAKFGRLWGELSEHLGARSNDQVAYELLNEARAPDDADWNRVYPHAFEAIRSREPRRTIVLGSNYYNSPLHFDNLAIPPDENCILTFHFYDPFMITHYRASWTPTGQYDGPVHYPGWSVAAEDFERLEGPVREGVAACNMDGNPRTLAERIAQPLAARRRTELPLYCGEFGCIRNSPGPVRLAWYRDLGELFRQEQIAWANWDYRGGFGVLGPAGEPTAISDALLR